ncbi:MAG: restriction endonuclease subunit S [Acidobacteriota bacterium]
MTSNNWQRFSLGELVENGHGLQTGPFGSQLHAADYVAEGIPVVMPRDLAGNVITTTNIARVSGAKAKELQRYQLRAGDIILARRGKIGRCALISTAEDGWVCGTGCLRARLKQGVLPEFLSYLLQWQPTVTWLTDNAVGQTMKNLNTKILAALPLDIPPLPTQQKIAEVLASVDVAIGATQRVMEQTVVVKRGFLHHLLSYGADSSRSPRPKGDLRRPPGWETRPIGELCTFVNGHGFRASEWSESGLPIIRIQNLNGTADFKYFDGTPKESCLVETGELLFAWAGVRGVSFGPRLWNGPPGVLNQHIYRVRPRDRVAKVWLFETLRQVTRKIEERAQGFKASLLHIRKADITEYPVAVPPYEEQLEIAERAEFISQMESLEQSNIDGLLKMKKALMGDLFSGRVSADRARASVPA